MTTTTTPAGPGATPATPEGQGTAGGQARRPHRSRWLGQRTPARLRRAGLVLVLGCLLTALVSLLLGAQRTTALSEVVGQDAALAGASAEIYQALADADAMATSGYVSAGQEPAAVRTRYDDDVNRAGQALARASGLLGPDDPAAKPVATMVSGLAGYTGLIATARTYNRQGLPLGQSYLDLASRQMRSSLLPAADELRRSQVAAVNTDYHGAGGLPLAVLLLGLAALAAGVDLSRREYRRTRRRLNPGLVVAGVLVVVGLLWWVVATVAGTSALAAAREHSDAATALDEGRILVLQARSNESLVLVARSGGSASDSGFTGQLGRLLAADGPLATAERNGVAVQPIRAGASVWSDAHARLRALDDGGKYTEAVASAVGTASGTSGAGFTVLDTALADAAQQARQGFADEAGAADGAFTLLDIGPALLFALAAGAVAAGIARRVGDYR